MSAIAYLEELQRQFGAMLRTPLDRTTGTLRAEATSYPGELVARVRSAGLAPAERLAVYNRQYWFRLFGVLQADYRLTTALLGAWTFNDLAARYLVRHPPTGHELASIGAQFVSFLAGEPTTIATRSGDVPRDMLVEAAAIDAAFHAAVHAPQEPPLALAPADAPRLATARLVWSRSFTLVEESWPLMELRHALPVELGDHQATLPSHHAPRAWVIHATASGLRFGPIDALHAELLKLLRVHAIGDSLAMLEARGGDQVTANARRWFAEGMHHGYWTGLEGAA